MNTLAHAAWDDGPGPWVLLFPLLWAAIVVGAVWLLRRTVWRGRGPGPGVHGHQDPSPVTLLGRRFAAGEIDEEEYRRRRAVLTEERGGGKGEAAA